MSTDPTDFDAGDFLDHLHEISQYGTGDAAAELGALDNDQLVAVFSLTTSEPMTDVQAADASELIAEVETYLDLSAENDSE